MRNSAIVSESFGGLDVLSGSFPEGTTWVSLSWKQLSYLASKIEEIFGDATASPVCEVFADLYLFSTLLLGEIEDDEELLVIKLSADGEIEGVYPPAVFEKDGTPVLKIGRKFVPIVQDDGRFQIAGYPARLRFVEHETFTEVFLRVTIADVLYTVKVVTLKDLPVIQDEWDLSMDRGESIVQFLAPAPGGSKTYGKLKDLPLGDHKIVQIVESNSEYSKFNVVFESGEIVAPNAYLEKKIGGLLANGVPISAVSKFFEGHVLSILEHQTLKNGNVFVKCQLKSPTALGIKLAGGSNGGEAENKAALRKESLRRLNAEVLKMNEKM